jgi:hypothetical protein
MLWIIFHIFQKKKPDKSKNPYASNTYSYSCLFFNISASSTHFSFAKCAQGKRNKKFIRNTAMRLSYHNIK